MVNLQNFATLTVDGELVISVSTLAHELKQRCIFLCVLNV